MTMPSTSSFAFDSPERGAYLNGLRLLRLVRLRRECRLLAWLAVAGTPVWFGLIVLVQAVTPDGSAPWNLADAAVGPGFAVLAAVFVIAALGLIITRVAGHTGRFAAKFVPVVTRGGEPVVEGDGAALRGLLPRLRRKPPVSIGLIMMFLFAVAFTVVTTINIGPAWSANHGRGGDEVTIGQNAAISRVQTTSRGGRDYFLATPDGEAIAEDGHPVNGEHWEVLNNEAGNDMAYLIGGHDYLLLGALTVVGFLADIGILAAMVLSFRREHRMRTAAGHTPLAYSVRMLAAGARPLVRFDPHGPQATIGLPPLRQDTDAEAQAVVRHRRRNATIVSVVVIAIIAGGCVYLFHPKPPTSRDVTLPYLSSTSWNTDIDVDYTDPDNAEHNVLKDMLGHAADPVWQVFLTPRTADSKIDLSDVEVAGIGSMSDKAAVAGGITFEKEIVQGKQPSVAVSGLPVGWAGVVTSDDPTGSDRTAEVFGAGGGTLIDIEVEGTGGDSDLIERARGVAVAIAGRGIAGFVQDTSP